MTASPLAQTPNDMFNAPIAEADPEIAKSSTPNCPGSKTDSK